MNKQSYKRSLITLGLALALSACGSSNDKDDTEHNESIPNIAPAVSGNFGSAAENTSVTLTVSATDSDGSIVSYLWQQSAGPNVEISGATTDSISFTAPSVSEDTAITFNVTVTDDDGDSTTFSDTLTVIANTISYNLGGNIASPLFANAPVTVSVAGKEFSTIADANGNFNIDLALDEEASNFFTTVTATAPNRDAIEYTAFVRQLNAAATQQQRSSKIQRATAQATDSNANTVTLSEVSTALVSLVRSANHGELPADLASFSLVEKEVDPDELLEASALIKYIADNDAALPEGIDNVVALIQDTAAYNTYLETVETANPGTIAALVDQIVADPELTPAVSALPSYYVSGSAVAPGFLSRGGDQFTFNEDATGSLITMYGASDYQWSLSGNTVNLNFTGGRGEAYTDYLYDDMQGFTAEEIQTLRNSGYFEINAVRTFTSATLTRLVEGQSVDSYKITMKGVVTLGPIKLDDGRVIQGQYDTEYSFNSAMRKPNDTVATFNADDIAGSWAIQYYNSAASEFVLDPYVLTADNKGSLQDEGTPLTWELVDGALKVTFADGSYQVNAIVDQLGSDLQLFSTFYTADGEVLAGDLMYGFKMDATTTEFPSVQSASGMFWQTMINEWDKDNWINGRLAFYSENDPSYEQLNLFGWKLTEATSYRYDGVDGDESSYVPTGQQVTWQQDNVNGINVVTLGYVNSCNDVPQETCRFRDWQLLKQTDGVLGKRLYVKEYDYYLLDENGMRSSNGTASTIINSRLNIYEEIPEDYWMQNQAESTAQPASVKSRTAKVAVPRLVLHPTQPLFGSAK